MIRTCKIVQLSLRVVPFKIGFQEARVNLFEAYSRNVKSSSSYICINGLAEYQLAIMVPLKVTRQQFFRSDQPNDSQHL